MSPFGQVFGDLPLLHLPPQRISRLSGQTQWDLMEQIRHNCIRRAWFQSARTGEEVRVLLDLAVGRAFVTYAELLGHSAYARFLDMDMEHARRMNELWTCFGFFLGSEIDHLVKERRAGPVLRTLLPPEDHALGTFVYAELLKAQLTRCRGYVRGNQLAFDTVQFVQSASGSAAWLYETPPRIAAYFELGDMVREVTQAEIALLQGEEPKTLH